MMLVVMDIIITAILPLMMIRASSQMATVAIKLMMAGNDDGDDDYSDGEDKTEEVVKGI